MEGCRLIATLLCLISVLSFTRPQDCPSFTADLLGTTDASRRAGLIGDGFQAVSGDPSLPVSVQVHDSNIVCLRSGQTRDTYRGVSVVVNYTCAGAPSECTGTPTLSQFEFECVAGTWAASVDRSAANIITTPPSGSLSTTLRTDCGVCVSPARSIFAAITNNEQHCGSCNPACNTTQPSLMRCFGRLESTCCNFFENDICVRICTPPLVPKSNFDCVVDCGLLNINNGMVIYNLQGQDQTLMGATVTYTCNTGYTLNGSSMRTCQADGTWTGSDPTCDIVDCGTLTDPLNGEVIFTTTTFMSTATYSCNSGYILSGSTTRTCEASGTWSDTAPTCDDPVDCGPLMNPANGSVDITQGTTFNQVATYSCDTGYVLVGNMTRTCQADGMWSGSEPICAVDCGTLTNPDNGMVDTPQGTTFNQVATYSCNSGFELVGNKTRTCQEDGTWSESEPICDATDLNSSLCDAAIVALVIAVSLTSIFIVA